MAFASTVRGRTVFGNKRISWGAYTNSGTNGGDIDTGMDVCEFLKLQTKGSATATVLPSILVDVLPKQGGVVTVLNNTSADNGYWWAFGTGGND